LVLLAILFSTEPAWSQSPLAGAPTELAKENQSRVAASASEIKTVLSKDPGLKVELKHWIAADATSHGQIVSDGELNDEAIFERLDLDVQFRSVATGLVQKFGYLLPNFNPGSDLAREHELSVQERTRSLAQSQVEEAPQARQHEAPATQTRSAPAQGAGQTGRRAAEVAPLGANSYGVQGEPQVGTLGSVNGASAGSGGFPTGMQGSPNLNLNVSNSVETGPPSTSSILIPPRPSHANETPDPVQMVRKSGPYADIPSLYDMYMQSVARPATPRRFGIEVFENETADAQTLPMDLPAGPDYVVGPGDGLAFDLWGGVSQRLFRTVDREGRVSLPEVGPILISGKSLAEVQQNVQQILRSQFRDVSADVSLSRLRTIRVYEVGDVMNAGAYDISSLSTPLNALFAAGGPTQRGSLRIVKHFRGSKLIEVVDVYDLLLHGVKANLQRLENGDTVLVPPIGPQVTVEGMVRRPAIYELKDEKTLAGVLELAGGILPTAALRHIEVQRIVAHDKQTMLSLEIPETDSDPEVEKKLEAFEIHDGDMIRIYPIAPYNQDVVFVEGHVLRQGRYSYHEGMRVTDVISSYKDLLPEPSGNYAEIVRLNAPDFRPSVEGFSLAEALANPAHAPALHRLDTVRIFSRYDFEDAPTVSVNGAVRLPGTFQTPGQIHFREAIQLSGGVTPDALMDSAQIFRIMPDSSLKILSVNLKGALAGDSVNNILLQPRDRILIQQNAMRVDPPSVVIAGEVANPGHYPLTGNMRVSDLIQIAGGFKRSAFTQSADLTRFNPAAGQDKLGEHREINIATTLTGDHNQDLSLHDGDMLTIRQLAGWNDIGASVSLTGEVEHPGKYGIQPGERLSTALKRAGGFGPQAYVYAAILVRPEVRQLEDRSRRELIERIEAQQAQLKATPQTDASKKADQDAAIQQLQIMLERVEANVSPGRIVIRISPDSKQWEGTPNDVVLRDGDSLTVPKVPNFVLVSGAVYNETAITYRPGRSANWYLRQAGGPTHMADKSGIFVIRANGSIVGGQSSSGWWGGNPLSAALRPGDMVVVPEKALSPNRRWNTVLQTALTISSIATSAAIAAKF
jgi:polysaccharide export outer membrane protein